MLYTPVERYFAFITGPEVLVWFQTAPFSTTLTFVPHAAILIALPTSAANKLIEILTVAARLGLEYLHSFIDHDAHSRWVHH